MNCCPPHIHRNHSLNHSNPPHFPSLFHLLLKGNPIKSIMQTSPSSMRAFLPSWQSDTHPPRRSSHFLVDWISFWSQRPIGLASRWGKASYLLYFPMLSTFALVNKLPFLGRISPSIGELKRKEKKSSPICSIIVSLENWKIPSHNMGNPQRWRNIEDWFIPRFLPSILGLEFHTIKFVYFLFWSRSFHLSCLHPPHSVNISLPLSQRYPINS